VVRNNNMSPDVRFTRRGVSHNEMRQTDILIRLHAGLEVGTRDDPCGTIFTEIYSGYVRRVGKRGRGWFLGGVSLPLGVCGYCERSEGPGFWHGERGVPVVAGREKRGWRASGQKKRFRQPQASLSYPELSVRRSTDTLEPPIIPPRATKARQTYNISISIGDVWK
jgi:hypothetical protein